MKVYWTHIEYTFYIGANGAWAMHTFDTSRAHGEQYLDTDYNVSEVNPFLSDVEYDAWA